MAIKIKAQSAIIPIEIERNIGNEPFQFSFNATDAELKNFVTFAEKTEKKLAETKAKIEEKEEDEALEIFNKEMAPLFDYVCGKGAYNAVYDDVKSIAIVTAYFYQILEAVGEELSKLGYSETQSQKAKKYLEKKKKAKK